MAPPRLTRLCSFSLLCWILWQSSLLPFVQSQQLSAQGLHSKRCFKDADGATDLGSLVVKAFWKEITQTRCDPRGIARIYDAYFRSDLIVFDVQGNITANDLEEYKALSIGDGSTPGTVTYACEYQDVTFEATQQAFTEDGIYNDFVWIGNRIVQDSSLPNEIIQPRQYFIEMIGKSGSFLYFGKGKGSSRRSSSSSKSRPNNWYYEHVGKGKGSKYGGYTPHCHRPQIYTIVVG